MFTTIVLVLAVLGLMTMNSTVAYGQAISGNIVGTVMDSSSAVVSNASVEITKIETGATSSTRPR